MNWILWVILAVPVYIWLWRLSFRWLVNLSRSPYEDSRIIAADFVGAFYFSSIACWLVGPIALIGMFFTWLNTLSWDQWARKVGGETRNQRTARQKQEKAEMEERTEQLERVLDD